MPIKTLWIKNYEAWGQEDFKFLDISKSFFFVILIMIND